MGQENKGLGASSLREDRATRASTEPFGLGPDGRVSHSADELRAMVERLQAGGVAPSLIMALMPRLQDAAYNAEYERKGLSAWESPEYRPYCLACPTMRRMEHHGGGYRCSMCGAECTAPAKATGAS